MGRCPSLCELEIRAGALSRVYQTNIMVVHFTSIMLVQSAAVCKCALAGTPVKALLDMLESSLYTLWLVLSYEKNIGIRKAISSGNPEELDIIW